MQFQSATCGCGGSKLECSEISIHNTKNIAPDWRGEALSTRPILSMSYLGVAACIISIAQQARPKVIGHSEPFLPQFTKSSSFETTNSSQEEWRYFEFIYHSIIWQGTIHGIHWLDNVVWINSTLNDSRKLFLTNIIVCLSEQIPNMILLNKLLEMKRKKNVD